jgi:hypothetical protein
MPALLVLSRFRVAAEARSAFLVDVTAAVDVLATQPGCLAASVGQSTDEADLLVVRTEWVGVGAYRRALSSLDVKMLAVPILSAALDEPSAYELIRTWTPDGMVSVASGLAADAGEVGLGEAAGPDVRAVS